MSTTSSRGRDTTYPVFRVVESRHLHPNPWNPNEQDSFIYKKELASIRRFGFIVPIVVRPNGIGFQIIDGEHRYRAGIEQGMSEFPCFDVGPIPEDDARTLTVALNEIRGNPNPDKLRDLLADLRSRHSTEALLDVLPYSPEQFEGLIGSFDWSKVAPEPKPRDVDPERWVLRTYRMPASVATVLDEAISKATADGSAPDWQALEWICADYLGE